MKSEHHLSKISITDELKTLSAPLNGNVSDEDMDDDEDDNPSSIADADIVTAIDDLKTDGEKNPTESAIVLKQIRRLSSVESLPPPPPPPLLATQTVTAPPPPPPPLPPPLMNEDKNKSKESNK